MDFWFGGWSRWIGKRVDLRLLELLSGFIRDAVLAGVVLWNPGIRSLVWSNFRIGEKPTGTQTHLTLPQ